MNRSYASPVEQPMMTNAPMTGLPALTETQRDAVKDFLTLADAIGASLSSDDLEKFNAQTDKSHDAAAKLFAAFSGSDGWQALAKEVEASSHLIRVQDLKEARREFYPFSTATVALAQAVRQSKSDMPALKIFRCPMAKDAFAGAPNRADWIQLQPQIQNPWFGNEMLDCGTEVKP